MVAQRRAAGGLLLEHRLLRTAEERAVARRVLILPHSRHACPQHRRGVSRVDRGMGRHDDADGGFDAGGDVTLAPR